MLNINKVSFSYSKKPTLREVSLTAREGDFLAILGSNGAGKSTLIKLISGYLKPHSGSITFAEKNVSKTSAKELAKIRAVLEQECPLSFNYTVLEVVKFGGFAREKESLAKLDSDARDALKSVGLEGFENRNYLELSGGEKRRVQTARTLCQLGKNPSGKLLLLDEPSAGLDPAHSHLSMSAARKVADNGATVCAVLHDINLAASYADKIALLKNGELLKCAKTKEILDEKLLEEAYGTPCKLIKDARFKYPFAHFLANS